MTTKRQKKREKQFLRLHYGRYSYRNKDDLLRIYYSSYAMWSKITIGSIVLFLFGTFIYCKNHQALVNGERSYERLQWEAVERAANSIPREATTKSYAILRQTYFDEETQKYIAETNRLDGETAKTNDETARVNTQTEETKAQYQEIKDALATLMLNGQQASIRDMIEEVGRLKQENDRIKKENDYARALGDKLSTRSKQLNERILAVEKKASDQRSRISEPEVDARVLTSDPSLNFVIIDSGANKGIVSGSRLAVMRGNEKIAELNVTSVESNRAGADIVYGTLLAGERIHVGDRVVSVRKQK